MTQKQHNSSPVLDHLLKAVNGGTAPAGLESVRESLINKLSAAQSRISESYVDDDDTLKMPSMGMMTIAREVLSEPISLFATDLKCSHIVRVTIYQASLQKKTGIIEKDSVLAEFVLSEMQFGELMVNTNRGSGYPATLIKFDNVEVEPYSSDKDPTKINMASLLEGTGNTDDQIDYFIEHIQKVLAVGQVNNKLSKAQVVDIVKYLELIPGHVVSNGSFHVEQVNEALAKRIEEASLNIHLFARDVSTVLKLENK